jgi:hypothetical protein
MGLLCFLLACFKAGPGFIKLRLNIAFDFGIGRINTRLKALYPVVNLC